MRLSIYSISIDPWQSFRQESRRIFKDTLGSECKHKGMVVVVEVEDVLVELPGSWSTETHKSVVSDENASSDRDKSAKYTNQPTESIYAGVYS